MAISKIGYGAFPTGSVLQVLQVVDTTRVTFTTDDTWADLGNLSLAITPKFSTSKILISCEIGTVDHAEDTYLVAFKYVRGSTDIGGGGVDGSRLNSSTAIRGIGSGDTNAYHSLVLPQFLDSPSTTSATTYKVQYRNRNAGNFHYLRADSDNNNTSYITSPATLTLTEIQG
tara:strand:+ start:25 stop:540 length:516 start_codon:yes stop_codon:yes gene_type:complete